MSNLLRTVIVDDEPLALGLLESYVKKTPFLKLAGKFDNSIEALHNIKELNPDLLFLDIQMPELNGLELSKFIPEDSSIIFVTAFQQFAYEGFKVNALDYLLKPISYTEFLKASEKALKMYTLRICSLKGSTLNENKIDDDKKDKNDSIFIKSDYKLIRIDFQNIVYIEGLKDYIKFFVEGESKSIISRMSMKQIEEELPKQDFIRVHRSFIVNKKYIKVIDRNRIVIGKEYIPVSDSYKEAFNDYINCRSADK
ncbi:MAG: LytTR family DNA-binding domain-containing protein [Bacteroidales bacterium]|nr:LytTR family DNA-binding domain-containing protein [Bacteroidales bacterium]